MNETSTIPDSGIHQPQYQINLPNSNTVLVLGILSLVFCWLHILSIIGIVMGIVTLSLSGKEYSLYYSAPSRFTISSLNNVKAGRTCAIIGLIISVLVFVIALLTIIGLFALLPFWGMVD